LIYISNSAQFDHFVQRAEICKSHEFVPFDNLAILFRFVLAESGFHLSSTDQH